MKALQKKTLLSYEYNSLFSREREDMRPSLKKKKRKRN